MHRVLKCTLTTAHRYTSEDVGKVPAAMHQERIQNTLKSDSR